MKNLSSLFLIMIMVLVFFPLTTLNAQITCLEWNTFLGSSGTDEGYGIALDGSGNVYVTGMSTSSWGSPILAHSGSDDAFVAKLDSSGNLLWNTFLGCSSDDEGQSIALDGSGNVYVTGISWGTWGSPVNAFNGTIDLFVACLNSSGTLLWNTFLGSSTFDYDSGVVTDSSGNVYVTSSFGGSFGSPISAHSGGYDVMVACLNSSGVRQWHTFLGSSSDDKGFGIALDSSNNIFVTGYSLATWGSPVNSHKGNTDGFVAVLNSSGSLQWNTFFGSSEYDLGRGIAVDGSGNSFVTGNSDANWGNPVNAHNFHWDVCVVCLNSSGSRIWNTFLGCNQWDYGFGIALDGSGNINVVGKSYSTWGSPLNPHSGGSDDACVASLDSSGNLIWNTFLGSGSGDGGNGICLDSSGNCYVTGYSFASWGSPKNAYSGGYDTFVAKVNPPSPPQPDITANGSDGPISITESDTLLIRVSLTLKGITGNVDYWLGYFGPSGWVHYNSSTKNWEAGLGVTYQGPLMNINNKKAFQSKLSPGNYTFYFGVDMDMNGKITKGELYYDEVKVTVTGN